ncbi:GyrI-like domain-containing protein [Legionella rowbothamii]|uniref:GyrI-like domain-containing protein n=1 Tax=Legionella rowbothamii TaxID=96229 RepID=UPI0013EF8B4A|nr:GyrI-like domain-containing protein [Legionella rowbothamii]
MPSILPSLKQVNSFKVIGLSTRTQNSDEFGEKTAKLPNLWQQVHSKGLAANATIVAVYSDYESDANGLYTVTVGIPSDDTPAQLNSVTIETGDYFVFQGKGPMPATVVETWKRIWSYFERNPEYQRSFISDFEAYKGSDEVTIYIGVK